MDKQITRWARMGFTRVLMYGQWWNLQRDKTYRVAFNRARPERSTIKEIS